MMANETGATATVLHRARALSRRSAGTAEVDALLREDAPLYAGLTSGQAELARGHILLALGSRELPDAAQRYALDDIRTLHGAFAVASAARALRSAALPVGGGAADLLLRAILQMADRDETVPLPEEAGVEEGGPTTVTMEVLRTLAHLAPPGGPWRKTLSAFHEQLPPAASPRILSEVQRTLAALGPGSAAPACCCHGAGSTATTHTRAVHARLGGIRVEDQSGSTGDLASCLGSRPSVLAFFYTRCNNPEKCSLTVTRLARIRQALERDGLGQVANVLGMTYDPEFDNAGRLEVYGETRGMPFGPRCRLLRTVEPFAAVSQALELRVGYGPATVNQHAVEVALLDPDGDVTRVLAAPEWDEAYVYRLLCGSAPTAVST